jgi:hypothetical protein
MHSTDILLRPVIFQLSTVRQMLFQLHNWSSTGILFYSNSNILLKTILCWERQIFNCVLKYQIGRRKVSPPPALCSSCVQVQHVDGSSARQKGEFVSPGQGQQQTNHQNIPDEWAELRIPLPSFIFRLSLSIFYVITIKLLHNSSVYVLYYIHITGYIQIYVLYVRGTQAEAAML